MNNRQIAILIIWLLCLMAAPIYSQTNSAADEAGRYKKIEDSLDILYDLEKYDEAIALIYKVRDVLPDYGYELSNSLTIFYMVTGQYEKCMDVWEEGHKKGYFYGIMPVRRYEPFQEYDRFDSIMKEDTRLRELATQNAKSTVEVFTPKEMLPDKKCPLLVVLHGGGGSNERAKEHWKSDMLEQECIVAFIQSYFRLSMNTYGWKRSDPRTREDIKRIYQDLITKYPVDTTNVVVAGISAGGSTAIDIAMNEVIPLAGLIGVCPGMPPDFDSEKASALRKKGLRAYIIGGEKDYYLDRQNQMVSTFKEVGLPCKQIIIEGMGHQYPDDFSEWINSALGYVLNPDQVD